MPTYRLTVEYEGTRYHGWQEQQNARSVSGELRLAIQEHVPVIELGGAGRTDAGVHALAQTAHLRVREKLDPESLRREVNERLPSDIHVLSVVPAGEKFHARHDAVSRSYLYQISRRRTAFAKRYVWWVRRPLDVSRMEEAAQRIEGRHDFALFCERPSEQASTVVVLQSVEIASSGALILIRLVASHFLWKMVRRLVGGLVKAGTGGIGTGEMERLLDRRSQSSESGKPAEWTATASGLFLERVLYEGDTPLPTLSSAVPVVEERAPVTPRGRNP